ncbi:MAG TPA: Fe-Mn family superoxide dismutase [Bacteroidia bacterium]|nr:Fe-Mn family superoxide dismutase [Bacteroidia bacterium]HNU32007.1 Fe-Mn family superoxide dismutase [Bacteroidia bacterium]
MHNNSRRNFIKQSAIAGAGLVFAARGISNASLADSSTTFSLPALPYKYEELEPHIDALTMQIHHSKHHQAYVDNLNKALKDVTTTYRTIEEILKNISKHTAAVRNNGGGHYNHTLFWELMKPNGGGTPTGSLSDAINTTFGDFEKMKQLFNDAAKSRFGSGWAWLIKNAEGKLEITSTPNQDNPLMDVAEKNGKPVLALDVWEHAYYLKYQHKRADYVAAWWNVLNWDEAAKNFAA